MLALIVAYAKNRVIGNKGKIPWKIEGEQKRFRELTTGNVVIMGRCTYEEIGYPLPNRTTIVISETKEFTADNCYTEKSLDAAINRAEKFGKDIFISGGEEIYRACIDRVQKMYITEINLEIDGDRFFPTLDESVFEKEVNEYFEGEIPYTYLTYTRK